MRNVLLVTFLTISILACVSNNKTENIAITQVGNVLDIIDNKDEYLTAFGSTIDSAMYSYTRMNDSAETFDAVLITKEADPNEDVSLIARKYYQFLKQKSNIGSFKTYKIVVMHGTKESEFIY